MKNLMRILSFVLVFLMTSDLIAQSTIGLRAGVNLATMNEDPFKSVDAEMDKGLMVGVDIAVFSKVNFGELFFVQPEFHWVQKGVASTMETVEEMDVKMTYKVDYLELPVLVGVDYGDEKVMFNFYAGPSVGYALNKKFIGENADIGDEGGIKKGEFEQDLDWDDDYGTDGVKDNRFDISGVLGVGASINVGPGNIILDARYNFDFNAALTYENTPDPEPTYYKNRSYTITAGFSIPIGQ